MGSPLANRMGRKDAIVETLLTMSLLVRLVLGGMSKDRWGYEKRLYLLYGTQICVPHSQLICMHRRNLKAPQLNLTDFLSMIYILGIFRFKSRNIP